LENRTDQVKDLLRELKGTDAPIYKKLDLDKCERIVEKLGSFSSSCKDCQQHLLELMNVLNLIKGNFDRLDGTNLKQFKQLINGITSHLQNKHKMVQEGHYLALFISLGMSLGVVFGLTIFDNIGLGIPIGMSIGLAIGAGLDADAKKNGKTI
jgi:hypothetical protein